MTDDARQSVAASDLPTRFAIGVALVAVALAAIFLGGWAFRLLVVAAGATMLIEWAAIHKVEPRWGYVGAGLFVISLLAAAEYLFPVSDMDEAVSLASFDPVWPGLGSVAAGALVLGGLTRRWAMLGGYLYIAVPAFALLVLEWFDFAWPGLVLWAMVVTWSTDIFAYAAGRTIGGPKLAPRLSPNKTWAGLIGGVIGAAVAGWLIASWFDLGSPFAWAGGAMALLAQAGDLYESRVKRRAGVKDSGTLLPGHGGVLDRLDGLIPVAVATLAILMTGLWSE